MTAGAPAASGLSVRLYLGLALTPAPASLMSALDAIEVTRTDAVPSGFQITFLAERGAGITADYPVFAGGMLDSGTRLAVAVSVYGQPSVVIDGFITHQQLVPATPGADARLVVTGEDLSVQMALYEYSLEYPFMPDAAIAELVLAKWMLLGVLPEVIPTPSSWATFTNVPQQVGNDRDYLASLAAQHGYVFFLRPGGSVGESIAYWGPPPRDGTPQPALTVDAGGGGNVIELRFAFDALAPRLIYGMVEDPYLDTTLPVLTAVSTRLPPLAADPVLPAALPFLRTTLFDHQGLNAVQAYAKAQAITDRSTDEVVMCEGSLDVLRYGQVLDAPGVVAVRGAGSRYDGLYYVKSATHQISRRGYAQQFKLTREGLGTTVATVAG